MKCDNYAIGRRPLKRETTFDIVSNTFVCLMFLFLVIYIYMLSTCWDLRLMKFACVETTWRDSSRLIVWFSMLRWFIVKIGHHFSVILEKIRARISIGDHFSIRLSFYFEWFDACFKQRKSTKCSARKKLGPIISINPDLYIPRAKPGLTSKQAYVEDFIEFSQL